MENPTIAQVREGRIRYERERDYLISLAEAWRLLADTDHLNRSIGLPAIDFSPMDGAHGKVVRNARSRAFGVIPVRWKEYPFEWVRERRYVVRREFESGPIAVIEGGVELSQVGDAVRVKAFADFTPANFTGRVLWRLGAGTVENTAMFCDRYLARKVAGKLDPTPAPQRRPRLDRAQLENFMERLRQAPVRRELPALLERTLVEASDDQLYRIRPYALADAWGVERFDVLRLFLHAARLGLFELRWELLCPNCRVPKAEANGLAELPPRYHCDTCGIDYVTAFDERVELRFSVHPSVRRVDGDVYCIGGPLRTPHIMAQQYLRASEGRRLELSVQKPLRLRAIGGASHLLLVPSPQSRWSSEVSLIYAEGHWTGPHSLLVGQDSVAIPARAALNIRNQTGGPLLVVLEDPEWSTQATTAAEVTTLAEFREVFRSEMLAPGQEITVKEVALLSSRLVSSGSRFAAGASAEEKTRRERHLEFVTERASQGRGAVVSMSGETVTAAFHRIADAIATAIGAQRSIDGWCAARGTDPALRLALGVHAGPVTAFNGADRLEYFGRTVETAAHLAAEADPGDVVMLARVLDEARASLPTELAATTTNQFRSRRVPQLADADLVRLPLRAPPAAG